jgi:hypothetical protein
MGILSPGSARAAEHVGIRSGRAFRAIQSVITGLIVKMRCWAENIFIPKTFFAAFCRRMFHIVVERRTREPLRERRGRIIFSSRAPLLWFSAEPEMWRRDPRRRTERRRLISSHSLREHRVIPSSSSEFRYSTNRSRTMAEFAFASASRQFTLLYGCWKTPPGVPNSARSCSPILGIQGATWDL